MANGVIIRLCRCATTALLAKLTDVPTSAEGSISSATDEHNTHIAPHIGSVFDLCAKLGQHHPHFGCKGVALCGPVDGDGSNSIFDRKEQIIHRGIEPQSSIRAQESAPTN